MQVSLCYAELGNLSTVGYTPIEQMGTGSIDDETAKAQQAKRNFELLQDSPEGQAWDLIVAEFLCEKSTQTQHLVPTSAEVGKALQDHENFVIDCVEQLAFARQVCAENKVFHWPLRFFDVFTQGGFDCVLGNPPWEKPQVEDRKWFAPYFPAIAFAQTAAIRKKMVEALSKGTFAHEYDQDLKDNSEEAESIYEQKIFANYVLDLHRASMATLFCHLSEKDGGRFPLTGFGSTNLYAYLAEIALQLKNKQGSVGMVMPIGIVTDDATKKFSQQVFSQSEISSVYHFNNTENIFPAVDGRYSFVLLTLHPAKQADCVFYATKEQHLQDERRHIYFAPNDMALMNPNTQTLPLVRTEFDLKLCRKLYHQAPVFINQNLDNNPWPVVSLRGFNMTDDSRLFISAQESAQNAKQHLEPMYEGKLFWQFDHRFASFKEAKNNGKEPDATTVTNEEKEQSSFTIQPRYWVSNSAIQDKLVAKNWSKPWLISWRDIARSTDERTLIATVLPSRYALGGTIQTILPNVSSQLAACLLATLNSLVVDYVQRIKQSGMHCNLLYVRQLPILPPEAFKDQDVAFICERVAKLTRTADDINEVWLTDYPAYTFQSPEKRLQIRCELDAYIARMYGLTREEMHYIIDPADAMNDPTFPSVTFPGLKNKEIKLYGEYRTQRLVLKAFDDLEAGTLK